MKNFYFLVFNFLLLTNLQAQIQIGQTIIGENAGDRFGTSTAISADGTIIAISAVSNDDNGTNSGHVRIFENQNGNWIQVGNAIAGENESDQFGRSLSLSSDGTILAIGTTVNDDNGITSGHVRVFENQNGNWIQVGSNINGIGESDQFGRSLSLSSDGTILAVGAGSGYVRVFENQNDSWIQVGDVVDPNNPVVGLGRSVSLSLNGNIIAINLIDPITNNFDIARVYENINGSWIQIGSDINGDSVGFDDTSNVRLSSDGNVLAFNTLGFDNNNAITGTLKVYENVNNTWVQIGNTIFAEDPSDTFGVRSLSLSSDSTIIAIGSNTNDGNGTNSGHVRIYENQNGIWTQLGGDIDGESAGDFFGVSINLSGDGSTLVVGADGNDDNGNLSGHAKVYDLSALLSVNEEKLTSFKLYPNPTKNQFTIQLENTSDLQNANIYNSLGQLVFTSKGTIIDVSKLASGLYTVEIETTKGKGTKKLIIE